MSKLPLMGKTPPCVCGKNRWNEHGLSLTSFLHRGLVCAHCLRLADFVLKDGGNLFIIRETSASVEANELKAKELERWFSKVVYPLWETYNLNLEEERNNVLRFYHPKVCGALGLPTETTIGTVPPALLDIWQESWRRVTESFFYWHPIGVGSLPIPEKIPEGVTCHVRRADEIWEEIGRDGELVPRKKPDPRSSKKSFSYGKNHGILTFA